MTTPSTCPPILQTETQWAACVPSDVSHRFWDKMKATKGLAWVIGQNQALRAGQGTIRSDYVFQEVPILENPGGVTVIDGSSAGTTATFTETRPRNLAEANLTYANELMSDAPMEVIHGWAQQVGVQRNQPDLQVRAGVAIITAAIATKANRLLPDAVAEAQASAGASGSFWDKFKNGWKKLTTDPGAWLQRVFVTEPGKAVKWAGEQLYKLSTAKWIKWVVDPLGVARVFGSFFTQIGRAMVEGSITAFDERAFALDVSAHWQQVGAALAVAAPFLPPPFNIIALGLGALFTAAGTALQMVYAQAERNRQNEAREKAAREAAEEAKRRAEAARAAAEYDAELTGEVVLSPDSAGPGGNLIFGVDTRVAAGLGLAALAGYLFYGT